MLGEEQVRITEIGRGTLDVALATPRLMVVATDSRRTSDNGSYQDSSKKLFVIGRRKALAIAGLADASLTSLPWLSAQVAPLLDWAIERFQNFDEFYWSDPAPPENLPPDLKRAWTSRTPIWWDMLSGPIQTVLNIAYTFTSPEKVDLWNYALTGIVAGFKINGEAKIERLDIVPQVGTSTWGRPWVGIAKAKEQATTSDRLIWKTAGITQLADKVLGGEISESLLQFSQAYPAIVSFLERRQSNTVNDISDSEMVDLSKDLIRATAALSRGVGREPIQMATIKPGEDVVVEQPTFPHAGMFLPADGTWHLGVVFTSDYPFSEGKHGVVFTNCAVADNRIPIPIGDNHFYGCEFMNALFAYGGGKISFGGNNSLRNCTLVIAPHTEETPLTSIIHLFTAVKWEKS